MRKKQKKQCRLWQTQLTPDELYRQRSKGAGDVIRWLGKQMWFKKKCFSGSLMGIKRIEYDNILCFVVNVTRLVLWPECSKSTRRVKGYNNQSGWWFKDTSKKKNLFPEKLLGDLNEQRFAGQSTRRQTEGYKESMNKIIHITSERVK